MNGGMVNCEWLIVKSEMLRLLPCRTLRSRYARNDKRESATPSARARDDKEGRLLPFRTLRSRYARNDKMGYEIASFQDAAQSLRSQ